MQREVNSKRETNYPGSQLDHLAASKRNDPGVGPTGGDPDKNDSMKSTPTQTAMMFENLGLNTPDKNPTHL